MEHPIKMDDSGVPETSIAESLAGCAAAVDLRRRELAMNVKQGRNTS